MSADERERAYWGPPAVTPERVAAWERWRDNYVVACAEGWIADGASNRDEIIRGAAAVLGDLARIEVMPWMTLGSALTTRMGAVLLCPEGTLEEPDRTEFIRALRTIETSTRHELTLALAYQLGISVQQATKEYEAVPTAQGRDVEPSGRVALYRHFDESGALLYVGIAKDPSARGEQHRYHSKWYRFVADTQIQWHADREAAEQAERQAIRSELPIFNQTHNRANRTSAIDYLYGALETAPADLGGAIGGAA